MYLIGRVWCIQVILPLAVYGDADDEVMKAASTDSADEHEAEMRAHAHEMATLTIDELGRISDARDQMMRAAAVDESEDTRQAHEEEMRMALVQEVRESEEEGNIVLETQGAGSDDPVEVGLVEHSDTSGLDEELHRPLSSEEMFRLHGKIDQNADGKLSLSELLDYAAATKRLKYAQEARAALLGLDLDHDEQLSREEMLFDMNRQVQAVSEDDSDAMRTTSDLQTAKFIAADKDSNDYLDKYEVVGFLFPDIDKDVLDFTARSQINRKDVNGDGVLSQEEFWGEEALSGDAEARFHKLDKDNDEQLNLNEVAWWLSGNFQVTEAMRKLMTIADTDMDNLVSEHELELARHDLAKDMLMNEAVHGHDFQTDAQFHLEEWNMLG